ncbi:MAG: radical SAM protein [Spirochaetes bacterium]|nr:MAG: radical SAM protein [Spirochaetota bacterium]
MSFSYDFPPYRPPSEAFSMLLRVTRGCPWNKCTFCSMYKMIRFERRKVDEIKRDIDTAYSIYGKAIPRVFIGDSNSLIIKTKDFQDVLLYLYKKFPNLERVTSYARAKTLFKKPIDELKILRKAGLTRLHIGLETGDAELLAEIKKGATPEEMIEGVKKAKQAGFETSVYLLLGIGGNEKWQSHAKGSAYVLNKMDPDFIRVRTLIPQPYSPIYDQMEKGEFVLASPETVLKEEYMIIERLNVHSLYLSDHVSNYLSVEGKLPEDKKRMLSSIKEVLDRLKEDEELKRNFEMKRYLRNL